VVLHSGAATTGLIDRSQSTDLHFADGVQSVPVQDGEVALAARQRTKAAAAREVYGVGAQLAQRQVEDLATRAGLHLCRHSRTHDRVHECR